VRKAFGVLDASLKTAVFGDDTHPISEVDAAVSFHPGDLALVLLERFALQSVNLGDIDVVDRA
jgi:hypothetical protein